MGAGIDVRRAVTDRIMAMLAEGDQACRRRWIEGASRGMPRHAGSGRPYRGVNALLLWDAAVVRGYGVPLWLTYRQAKALGAQVRKGEHGVLCAQFERDGGRGDGEPGGGPQGGFLRCRPFWLFNVAQVDGLPARCLAACRAGAAGLPPGGCDPMERALRLVAGCDAAIRHGFDRAVYAPEPDEIRLPMPQRFASREDYGATLLHALVCWTGHPRRLHRAFGARFGGAAGAFEALVAELGTVLLLAHCGLAGAAVQGQASHLVVWLEVLRNDRSAIFTAARLAGDAVDFILAREVPVLA